jgi:ribosomal protein S18 acetylase RimI-like enzyme
MIEMRVRRGTLEDAAAIAEIAERLFVQTFEPENDPVNVATHVSDHFGESIQRAELADPAITYLLLEAGTALVAFAELKAGSADPSVHGEWPAEIQRFYVDQGLHGQGAASRLMDACMREAEAQGAEVVWLGVWERNARAIRFYEKQGFVDVGVKTFLMGDDRQSDRVMMRRIT